MSKNIGIWNRILCLSQPKFGFSLSLSLSLTYKRERERERADMSKKGVMLSSQNGGSSGIGGSKVTLGSGGPSIGNYKGVMLCNRPFAGVRVQATVATNASKASNSFKAGIPDGRGTLGLNPTKRLLPHAKPVKKVTAMDKHKKWLKQFQDKRKALEESMIEDSLEKERRRLKFQKREEMKRKEVVGQRGGEGGAESKLKDEEEEEIDESKYQPKNESKYEEEEEEEEEPPSKISSESKIKDYTDDEDDIDDDDIYDADSIIITQSQMEKIQKRNKPAWAYTEEGKEKEEDDMEEEELQDLLDFTNNLDFEEFIEDLEVKHALEKLKKRVEELTPRRRDRGRVLLQKGMDGESLLQKAGSSSLRPLTKEALDELERQIGVESSKRQDHDARSVVSESSILSDTKSLRSVHSARSIAAIRKQIAAKRKKCKLQDIREDEVDASVYNEPVIVNTVDEEKCGGEGKFEAARLPYIRRNAAV